MQRKIIQHSPTSLGMSLPSKWIHNWNLKKGDTINILENKGVLEITADNFKPIEKKATIDVQQYGRLIRRKFNNLSKQGYEEITVNYRNEKELESIKGTLKTEATMFEMVKKTENHAVFRAITEISKEEFDNIFNRILFIFKEEIQKSIEYLRTQEFALLSDILELDASINRLAHLCQRSINRRSFEEASCMQYTFLWFIEKASNNFKYFANLKPKSVSKATESFSIAVLENVMLLMDSCLKYDTHNTIRFYESQKILAKKGSRMISQKNHSEHLLLHTMLSLNEASVYLLSLSFDINPRSPRAEE
jgi:phosphate uptake regulator